MTESTRPLRVLMVTARFLPLMGGIESHVYEVGRRLVADGHAVTVLTLNTDNSLAPADMIEGIRIQRVAPPLGGRDYLPAPALFGPIRSGQWDIVHCQGIHTLVPPVAMLAARQAKLPYVVTFHTGGHSSRSRTLVRGLQWRLLRPLLAHADKLIGVSRFEADLFRTRLSLPRALFTTIPNGGRLPEATAADVPDPKAPLILTVGRLERYKGHQRMIAAMPLVRAAQPKAHLLILGSGPYESELRALIRRLHVEDCVEIASLPPSDRQAMASLLARASLVTLMSDYEAHPIAVMEALAMRRPVLVTDTSGLREMAEDGYATAIPLSSGADETAAAVLQQLDRPSIPADIALPTWEDCAARLLDVYRSIVDHTSRPASVQAAGALRPTTRRAL